MGCKAYTHHMLSAALPPLQTVELGDCPAHLRKALDILTRVGSTGAVDYTTDDEFRDSLEQLFSDRADFRSGRLQQHS